MSDTAPTTPQLQPLLRERQFYAAAIIGLPGLAYAYVEAFRAIVQAEQFDAASVAIALAANPIVLYLLARQYARGKAVEAFGVTQAAFPTSMLADHGDDVEVTPGRLRDVLALDDTDRQALEAFDASREQADANHYDDGGDR